MKHPTRRAFLAGSLAAGGFLAARGDRVAGANSDIRIGMIGLGSDVKVGGKGRMDLRAFLKLGGVRIVALCDPDRRILDAEAARCADLGQRVSTYTDMRRMLENKEVDAVSIATPNHWHALATIWACQAGKDVYVQKPASHTLREGRRMVEAARAHGRIVYSASLVRSRSALPEAFAWAREGHLGKILYAHGLNYRPRLSIGRVAGPQTVPPHIDYNLWCGPAPRTPLMRKHLHYDWHWDFRYGNGDIGNMGIHYLDACRMALGQATLPEQVLSIGGRFGYDDDGTTPNTLVTFLDYKPAPILFEVRGLPANRAAREKDWEKNMDHHRNVRVGIVVHCEHGYIAQHQAFDLEGRLLKTFEPTRPSGKANFLDVLRSRRVGDLQGDILDGHLSAALVHMANASYRSGSTAGRDELAAAASGQPAMQGAFERFAAHLEANAVDVNQAGVVLGASLTMDPKRERFVGPMSATANHYLSKPYRKGFEMPARA